MGNPGEGQLGCVEGFEKRTLLGLVAVEVAVGDGPRGLEGRDDGHADDGLGGLAMLLLMHVTVERTWTANKKKFRLKSTPDRTYLLVVVIRIDEPQYARMESNGLSVMAGDPWAFCDGRIVGEGALNSLTGGISMYSSCFLSSAMANAR